MTLGKDLEVLFMIVEGSMWMQEEVKNEFLSKRESIINAVKNKVTLNNWDGSSSLWVYNVFVNKIIYIYLILI